MIAPRGVLVGAVLGALACSTAVVPDDGSTWVGTITTEDTVTTVVNESGSVWGGDGRLVEQASIGVAEGDEPYMLGMITGTALTLGRIVIADAQAPAVRVYGPRGAYLHTLGGPGQGPGEYRTPAMIATDGTGRIYVFDDRQARINVYAPNGEHEATWPLTNARCCLWKMFGEGGRQLLVPVQEWLEEGPDERRYGVQTVGADGPTSPVAWLPDLEVVQARYKVAEDFEDVAPFSPWLTWSPAPGGRLVVGDSGRYRFEVRDGDSTLVVERSEDARVAVPPDHRDYVRRTTIARHRRMNRRTAWDWDGAEIPRVKPAYAAFVPALSGEIWVLRLGASERHADCAEDPIEDGLEAVRAAPCWTEPMIADVFDTDGRFLGSVPLPTGAWAPYMTLSVRNEVVVLVVQNDEGVYQVKRYRLETPGA